MCVCVCVCKREREREIIVSQASYIFIYLFSSSFHRAGVDGNQSLSGTELLTTTSVCL